MGWTRFQFHSDDPVQPAGHVKRNPSGSGGSTERLTASKSQPRFVDGTIFQPKKSGLPLVCWMYAVDAEISDFYNLLPQKRSDFLISDQWA